MPSEHPRPRLLALLRSQGLGLLCGAATVLLLAIGSVVIAATREGASRDLRMDELTPFFREPSPFHLWLYLLVPVLALYGLNILLCTWDSVSRRWRAGLRSPSAHAPAFLHVALLVALLAHAIGGLGGGEAQPVLLDASWRSLEGERLEARLYSLRIEEYPDRTVKQVEALVEVRQAGRTRRQQVSFNGPLSFGLGSRLYLLARYGHTGPDQRPAILLRSRRAPGNPWALGASLLILLGSILMGRRWL